MKKKKIWGKEKFIEGNKFFKIAMGRVNNKIDTAEDLIN